MMLDTECVAAWIDRRSKDHDGGMHRCRYGPDHGGRHQCGCGEMSPRGDRSAPWATLAALALLVAVVACWAYVWPGAAMVP